jgi:hypothetical protein
MNVKNVARAAPNALAQPHLTALNAHKHIYLKRVNALYNRVVLVTVLNA